MLEFNQSINFYNIYIFLFGTIKHTQTNQDIEPADTA